MPEERYALWRRLDCAGHDACRMYLKDGDWIIEGCAVFTEAGKVSRLDYRVTCDAGWRTMQAWVSGWHRSRPVSIHINRGKGERWIADGVHVVELDGAIDIDLGCTPATNTIAIRRLRPSSGGAFRTTSVWLDTDVWSVKLLEQEYLRETDGHLAYRVPALNFHAMLQADDFGIVVDYPGLWIRE